ncbi:MAG: hypothetical protein K0S47_3432 [Herbinix sp.]|jgi:hypothetical protein|nr:hypothetical protein [Herbinix sp.]
MEKGYRTIFWGFFIATFHISIQGFQILPVFLGWLIVAQGISILHVHFSTKSFLKAKVMAILIIIYSLLWDIKRFVQIVIPYEYIISSAGNILLAMGTLWMEFLLLEGSIAYLQELQLDRKAVEYGRRLRSFLVISLIQIIFLTVTYVILDQILITVSAICAIILVIWFINIISSLRKNLSEEARVN